VRRGGLEGLSQCRDNTGRQRQRAESGGGENSGSAAPKPAPRLEQQRTHSAPHIDRSNVSFSVEEINAVELGLSS
jgi:hypothetical protein